MVRAIVSQGVFKPLDPLPNDWLEGAEVVVNVVSNRINNETEIDQWYESFAHSEDPFVSSQDEARFDATLAELKAASIDEFDQAAGEIGK